MIAATIGHNGGPSLDDDEEDKSPPTVEEGRIVMQAIRYLQWKVPDLEEICTKRKGGRVLGWRHIAANCLKGRARRNSVAFYLGKYDEKLTGESQQRPDAWAAYDDEHGTGEFGALLANLREAIDADFKVDVPAMDAMIKRFVKMDPDLRRLENQQRLHEHAANEAEKAARALELKASERKKAAKRFADATALKKTLKGVKGGHAIVAQHLGAPHLASTIGADAIEAIKVVAVAEAKGVRHAMSSVERKVDKAVEKTPGETGAAGVDECLRFGLVRQSQPYLAPPVDDPPLFITELGLRVFDAALKKGRIVLDKKRKTRS